MKKSERIEKEMQELRICTNSLKSKKKSDII